MTASVCTSTTSSSPYGGDDDDECDVDDDVNAERIAMDATLLNAPQYAKFDAYFRLPRWSLFVDVGWEGWEGR